MSDDLRQKSQAFCYRSGLQPLVHFSQENRFTRLIGKLPSEEVMNNPEVLALLDEYLARKRKLPPN